MPGIDLRFQIALLSVAVAGCVARAPRVDVTPAVRSTTEVVLPVATDDAAKTLTELHEEFRSDTSGTVAHNDVAAGAGPEYFGIAIATIDGQVISVGDAKTLFPLQSLSKVFNLALALEDHGPEEVLSKVGTCATGLPFDSLLATEVRATRLQNPMVSSGAIAVVSLISGEDNQHKWQRMENMFSEFAGHALRPLADVFEAETSDPAGSLAKAWVLKMYGLLYSDPENTVQRYLRGCSIGVTTEDLAVMGATLANWGVNPRTGRRVMEATHSRGVLSAMVTSGMYDDSGPWLFHIGLPAKSGVSGGVVAIVPGRFAIAVYSPPLDERGNSVRAALVIRELSDRWALHVFEPPRASSHPRPTSTRNDN